MKQKDPNYTKLATEIDKNHSGQNPTFLKKVKVVQAITAALPK